MIKKNLTPLVRWTCLLSASAVVVLAAAGMSCSTNGEAETGDTQTTETVSGRPVVVQAWMVVAKAPFVSPSAEGIANAARGDLSTLFPGSGGGDLAAVIQQAADTGTVEVLLAPTFLTRVGEEFSARSGLQIPVQTTAHETVTVQYVDATARHEETVSIAGDGLLDIQLRFKKQLPRFDLTRPGSLNSPIQTTDADAVATITNGGTAVLSGIYEISGLFRTGREGGGARASGELLLFVTATLTDL